MAVIALGLIVGLFLAYHERKARAALFPPDECALCKKPIVHPGKIWVHKDTGKQMADYTVHRYYPHEALPPLHPWEY